MVQAVNLGYPRIGAHRELKRAVEAYWAGDCSKEELQETAQALRESHWKLQSRLGIDHIPSNDFSLYDQVLDMAAVVGAVPGRFGFTGEQVDLDTYFAMARGLQEKEVDATGGRAGARAMEMTKWYDTNYHYIVPELGGEGAFRLASTKPIDEFKEARALGIHTRPVLIGPVTFLLLSKAPEGDIDPLDRLGDLLPVYEELFRRLEEAGCTDVQLDEPHLALDLSGREQEAFGEAYDRLSAPTDLDLHVTTYFAGLRDNMPVAFGLPVTSVHLDLIRAPEQLDEALDTVPDDLKLSLGLIDGRNVWRADLDGIKETVVEAARALGPERVLVGPSCSLLHVPVDLDTEPDLDEQARSWLAFAKQKLEEVSALARAANSSEKDKTELVFEASRNARQSREGSDRVHNRSVKERTAAIEPAMTERQSPFGQRRPLQQERLDLPRLPTTTIGSFPQTKEVRRARSAFKKGNSSREEYETFIEEQIENTIRTQEEIGLDVLVHGEAERGDMVEYFGRRLDGFLFTENGWVQSYGSRCVRPPVIYGDVSRPEPMTVRWIRYAQSVTDRPVKGMLTGPVTILQWSFVRDDQSREETCRQIALAMREEVMDLEEADIRIIQIDEPALREGLPLRRADWAGYLEWSVECFRLASSGVKDETQIHTHMCYSEFNDIIEAIAAMDADVISIESSRSKMELLDAFDAFDYPNQIGPGVYDIHSPRVPGREEIEELIQKAMDTLSADQLWVNPDCGLKTRRWKEVKPALKNMVAAARNLREPAMA